MEGSGGGHGFVHIVHVWDGGERAEEECGYESCRGRRMVRSNAQVKRGGIKVVEMKMVGLGSTERVWFQGRGVKVVEVHISYEEGGKNEKITTGTKWTHINP